MIISNQKSLEKMKEVINNNNNSNSNNNNIDKELDIEFVNTIPKENSYGDTIQNCVWKCSLLSHPSEMKLQISFPMKFS